MEDMLVAVACALIITSPALLVLGICIMLEERERSKSQSVNGSTPLTTSSSLKGE